MPQLIERARDLAREKHAGVHLFDEGRTGMFEHISQVADFVQELGGSSEMITAAWLHDIVEDTDVTLEQVREQFGMEVANLVEGLTDPEHFEALPLEQRKQLQAERLATLPDDVRRIKICDQLSNVQRIVSKPPLDWSADEQWTYIQGARKLALECKGLWPTADGWFNTAYVEAASKYRPDENHVI